MQQEIIATNDCTPGIVKEALSLKGLFKEIMDQVEDIPCDQCGYIVCVCTNERYDSSAIAYKS